MLKEDKTGITQGYVGLAVILMIMIFNLSILMDVIVSSGFFLLFIGIIILWKNGRSKKL